LKKPTKVESQFEDQNPKDPVTQKSKEKPQYSVPEISALKNPACPLKKKNRIIKQIEMAGEIKKAKRDTFSPTGELENSGKREKHGKLEKSVQKNKNKSRTRTNKTF